MKSGIGKSEDPPKAAGKSSFIRPGAKRRGQMRIAIGSDHRGFRLKEKLKTHLAGRGHTVMDMGTDSKERTDYPVFAFRVAEAVRQRRVQRGILICGTGIGMSMAANRVQGVRAALCNDLGLARMSRLHNNANVLCLGGDILSQQKARGIVNLWLRTPFQGGRHRTRLRAWGHDTESCPHPAHLC